MNFLQLSLMVMLTNGLTLVEAQEESCDCLVNDPDAATFKCGEHVYACPGVLAVCNRQGAKRSNYYMLTSEECDVMKSIEINSSCVALDRYGITSPSGLSNRVCYDDSESGINGLKVELNDESGLHICEACKDVIFPEFITDQPSSSPTEVPSASPSDLPSTTPSDTPSDIPSVSPSDSPSGLPSTSPSDIPSTTPSTTPSDVPSDVPSATPSDAPSDVPSATPSDVPSDVPSATPSDVPSDVPSATPSDVPSDVPSATPSDAPSDVPSATPSDVPSDVPSTTPSDAPSDVPSTAPSDVPSDVPSTAPSDFPSDVPSATPSDAPSDVPSITPSNVPSTTPSDAPSKAPTDVPSKTPTLAPIEPEDESCDCLVNNSNAKSFKCGNRVMVCPGVTDVCSNQASAGSGYFRLTDDECMAMKAVEIGGTCVTIVRFDIGDQGNGLSNRVCYDGIGSNGMKTEYDDAEQQHVCETCRDSIDVTNSIRSVTDDDSSIPSPDNPPEVPQCPADHVYTCGCVSQSEDIAVRRMLRGY